MNSKIGPLKSPTTSAICTPTNILISVTTGYSLSYVPTIFASVMFRMILITRYNSTRLTVKFEGLPYVKAYSCAIN